MLKEIVNKITGYRAGIFSFTFEVIFSGYSGLVHNAFCRAFPTERARFFLAAIDLTD